MSADSVNPLNVNYGLNDTIMHLRCKGLGLIRAPGLNLNYAGGEKISYSCQFVCEEIEYINDAIDPNLMIYEPRKIVYTIDNDGQISEVIENNNLWHVNRWYADPSTP